MTIEIKHYNLITYLIIACIVLLSGMTRGADTYDAAYVVDNLSSSNISITGSPYSMIKAWYKSRYGTSYWMDDVTINSFATVDDKFTLYFDHAVGDCTKVKITSWTWHPHYVALTWSDGTDSITGRLTVIDNTVVLKLDATNKDVLIVVSVNNTGVDSGGISINRPAYGHFHIQEDYSSTYARVGSYIDVAFSNTYYTSESVDINGTPSSTIAAQLTGATTNLNGTSTSYLVPTGDYGIVAANYNSGWSSALTVSISYSASSFADAEGRQCTDYTTAESNSRAKWITYMDKTPHIEPYTGNTMYWKSWALLAINGEDHTTNMAANKYDFVDSYGYVTFDYLGRQVIGTHKSITAGSPAYPRYWHFDNIWAPATLAYSDQTDVLKSMFKGNFDIKDQLGDVTDTWMEAKDNYWDNYQNCYFGDMLDLAYSMTGDSYYQNKAMLVNIKNQQFTKYKSASYSQLFTYPLTSGWEPTRLSCWRTGPTASLLGFLAEMDPNYQNDYNSLLSSMSYFWYTGGTCPYDYYDRSTNGSWYWLDYQMYSAQSIFYNPSLNYGGTVARPATQHWVEAPMTIALLTLHNELEKADAFRRDVFNVSDYFPEGINSEGSPSGNECVLHCSYVAHNEILAKIGMIPYSKNGYDGFVIAPNVTDITAVSRVHFPEADNAVIQINYHESGKYGDIYKDGSVVVNSTKRNFIPFTSFSGNVVDDMESVGDWTIGVGGGAIGGSMSTDTSDKRQGDKSGVLSYQHSTATSNDFVNYSKSVTLDINSKNLDFWLKQPNDTNAYLILRVYDSGSGWAEYNFPEGNDKWTYYSLKNTDFYDWGSGINFANVQTVRFHSNGDTSATATSSHYHVDFMSIPNIIDVYCSNAAVDPMDRVTAWITTVGYGATGGFMSTDASDKQEGTASAVLNYQHSTATGFDYIFYSRNINKLAISEFKTLDFWLKEPNDPYAVLQLRIYDSGSGWAEYTVPEGNGTWTQYNLKKADFYDWGSGMNYSDVVKVEIRSLGDTWNVATSNHYHIDFMTTPNIIDDMDSVYAWGASKGSGATSCSIITDINDKKEGTASAVLNYQHSTATGFDYINYSLATRVNLQGKKLEFWLKQPNDTNTSLAVRLYDGGSGWAEYNFPEGTDAWVHYSLQNSNFNAYGIDYSDIHTIRFYSNGDVSSTATTNHYHLDFLEVK